MQGFTAGVTTDPWSAEVLVDNLTNERAEFSRNFVFDASDKPVRHGQRCATWVESQTAEDSYHGQENRREALR